MGESEREAIWLRGVSDLQIEAFRIGYVGLSPPEGPSYPSNFAYWWKHHEEKVTDSFVLPLTNWVGEIRGLQFRPLDRNRKFYMDYFLDRTELTLFGLSQAAQSVWDTGEVVVVEGGFDLLPVQRAVPNVISTLTAKVSRQLVRSLKRLTKTVHMFYDNDEPGRDGTQKFIKYHAKDLEIRAWNYPTGVVMYGGKPVKDPGDLWETWGDDRLCRYIKTQMR
jgi:hypothetical protein